MDDSDENNFSFFGSENIFGPPVVQEDSSPFSESLYSQATDRLVKKKVTRSLFRDDTLQAPKSKRFRPPIKTAHNVSVCIPEPPSANFSQLFCSEEFGTPKEDGTQSVFSQSVSKVDNNVVHSKISNVRRLPQEVPLFEHKNRSSKTHEELSTVIALTDSIPTERLAKNTNQEFCTDYIKAGKTVQPSRIFDAERNIVANKSHSTCHDQPFNLQLEQETQASNELPNSNDIQASNEQPNSTNPHFFTCNNFQPNQNSLGIQQRSLGIQQSSLGIKQSSLGIKQSESTFTTPTSCKQSSVQKPPWERSCSFSTNQIVDKSSFNPYNLSERFPFVKSEVMSPAPSLSNQVSLVEDCVVPNNDFVIKNDDAVEDGVMQDGVMQDGVIQDGGINNTIEEALYRWAVSENILSSLEKQLDEIEEVATNTLVYEFHVTLPVQDILDYNQKLGEMLLQQPIAYLQCLKKICYQLLSVDGTLKSLYSPDQLIITHNLTHIPIITEHWLDGGSSMKSMYGRLISIQCQVISLSCSVQYTKSATYSCPQTDCAWSGDNCFLLTSNVGMIEADIVRTDFPCYSCGAILEENVSQRNLSEKKYCYIIPKNRATNLHYHLQGIKAVLKDELQHSVAVGGYYMMTGVLRHDLTFTNTMHQDACATFEVLSIEKDVLFINTIKSYEKVLPDVLCSLYHDRIQSPWSFVASLAYSFLDSITPPGTYYLFKLCLLLNVIMEDSHNNIDEMTSSNCHLLVEGDDMVLYERMMREAAIYCSQPPIVHTTPSHLFATTHKEDGNLLFVNGGSLSLASCGICIIPNLLQFKKADCQRLQKVCETHEISVVMAKHQQTQQELDHVVIPFKASIWCCSELQRTLSNKSNKEVSSVLPALSRQFHVIFRGHDQLDNEYASLLTEQLLQRNINTHSPAVLIPSSRYKEYISAARKRMVTLPKEVYNLLKAFYLIARKMSRYDMSHIDMETLLYLATGHAKAMLRNEVTVDDAVMSIYLYEQINSLRYGDSLIGVQAVFHFQQEDMYRYMGPQNDEKLFQLKQHIIQYCSNHFPQLLTDI